MSQETQPQPDELELEEPVQEERQPWWQQLVAGSSAWIGLILVGLIVVFAVLKPADFLTVSNGRNIATDAAVLLVLATGLTYVIITAGIDLSVGSVLVFSGVIAAKVMNAVGGNNWGVMIIGLVVALLAGLAWGILNGFLVS
jgi:ribose transport system permease protein